MRLLLLLFFLECHLLTAAAHLHGSLEKSQFGTVIREHAAGGDVVGGVAEIAVLGRARTDKCDVLEYSIFILFSVWLNIDI